jgi:histidine triad (HIT) family protein
MSSDPDCIFCKIIAGEIPSERVYEDEQIVAFLDIGPIARGHALVIPREHHRDLLGTPPELLGAVMAAAQRVAGAVMKATDSEGFNLFQFNGSCAGQEVFHLHFHVIPRRPGDGVRFGWSRSSYGEGEMGDVGARIREALAD